MSNTIFTAHAGLTHAANRLEASARKIANPTANTDMIDAMTDIIVAKNDFTANLNVMKTADRMQQDLLAIFK